MKLLKLIIGIIPMLLLTHGLWAEAGQTPTALPMNTTTLNMGINQIIIVNFENPITGTLVAKNRYGLIQVDQLSNKAISILVNINADDSEAILSAFKGRIIIADSKCNQYLFNIQLQKNITNQDPKSLLIKANNTGNETCESIKDGMYPRPRMLSIN